MHDDEIIISALYGDDEHRQSIERELRRAGITPTIIASEALPQPEIPAWVSSGGAGATHYVAVKLAQRDAAAKILIGLDRICRACGTYFPDEFGHCPVCNEVWTEPPAE